MARLSVIMLLTNGLMVPSCRYLTGIMLTDVTFRGWKSINMGFGKHENLGLKCNVGGSVCRISLYHINWKTITALPLQVKH